MKFIPSLWSPHHHYPRFICLSYFQVIFFNRSPILNPRSLTLNFQQTLDERQFSSMCLKTFVASFASAWVSEDGCLSIPNNDKAMSTFPFRVIIFVISYASVCHFYLFTLLRHGLFVCDIKQRQLINNSSRAV